MSTETKPVIAGQTADDYREALRRLVEKCEEHTAYTDHGEQPGFDAYSVYVPLRGHFTYEAFHRRERRTAAEEYRSALKSLVEVCDEYADVADRDFWHLRLDPFEQFDREVKRARRTLDNDWADAAPEDDTNPVIVRPTPVPDPTAEPINKLGVRQGDWVGGSGRHGNPVQILTGVNDRGLVRVSDHRDGTADWRGMHMSPDQIGGEYYPIVPAPTAGQEQGPA